MKKYLFTIFMLINAVSFADTYYITSGDAALEIYEREQEKNARIRDSYLKNYRQKKIDEAEKKIKELLNEF